jgi:hypothetical protein
MNGLYTGFSTGIQAGYQAARRVFEDPSQAHRRAFADQQSRYGLLWGYYNNSAFDKSCNVLWDQYRANYNLYRHIRPIFNPTRRLVDFYASQVYPGILSEDGRALPDGVPIAVPFSEDTPAVLRAAAAQLWQWSNWQAKKSVYVRYGAALGDVFCEVVDDTARGKVTLDVVWPGFITNLSLDAAGNVKAYTLEYPAIDGEGSFTYRKEVDQEVFRYYRNNELYDYSGYGAEVTNPYGFVPATWTKHSDSGDDHGSPAIAGSLNKIDELNALASHIHDQIHKVIGAPLVIFGSGTISNLFSAQKRGPTNEFTEPSADQESVFMLKGPADGKVASLAGDLSLADAAVYMTQLLGEIEQDNPELAFYRELRSMSQVTGPAASRLVGDVASRVFEAQAAYDGGLISLTRMAVAIAGQRVNDGSWGSSLTPQQQKFAAYDLESFARGDLAMEIAPRPLLTPTKLEQALEDQAMWQGVNVAVQAGVPLEVALRREGWTEEELRQLGADQVAQIQRDQLLAAQDTIPTVAQ